MSMYKYNWVTVVYIHVDTYVFIIINDDIMTYMDSMPNIPFYFQGA